MSRLDLKSLDLDELKALATRLGEPSYRGEQLFRWVHGKGATSWTDMKNLPNKFLSDVEKEACLSSHRVADVQVSGDGTRKLRLATADGLSIETVLIPDGDKMTQCISSQVGCALDCRFCATAKLGLLRHLSAGEIVDQVYRGQAVLAEAEPGRRITNLVYMGMGEPLHNFDQVARSLKLLTAELGANLSLRRITVSTVGLVPGIRKLGELSSRPNLAVSLNASNDEVRDQIMPINRRYPLAELLAELRRYPLEKRRRITFEYVLLAGVNDTVDDADRLGDLLGDFRCKLNIIPWNPHPAAPYSRPSEQAIEAFQARVKLRGLPCYLRTPRGDDIEAACGQLANRVNASDPIVRLRGGSSRPNG